MWIDILVKIIVALCGLANLLLAFYVYRKNIKDRVNVSFFYFGSATALWCFTNFASMMLKDLFWLRSTYAVSCILALAGVFFTYALSNKKLSKFLTIFLSVITAVFFLLNLLTPLSIESITSFTGFGFETVTGPLIHFWEFYFFSMVLIIVCIPLSVINKVDEQRKRQILYFLAGETIFAFWGIFVTIVLPMLGVSDYINLDSPSTIFLIGFTSYAIIRYHLMGISSLFFQAFIYSLVIISIITSLLLLMFGGSYLFAHAMIWPLYVIVAIVSVVLFFIGRLFFVEKKDLEEEKINLTELLKVSEKNRIEAETERDKTGSIIKSFSDGLIILDEQKNIFSINPEAEKILELKASQLLKKSFKNLANFPKASPIYSILKDELTNVFRKEVDLERDFVIELTVMPLRLDKKDIGHLIVVHDVSREKMVEKMKTEFVSLAAHQLRTPLTAVSWAMESLKTGGFGKLTEQQCVIVENTLNKNRKLISLVNNLLDITRIEGGKYLYDIKMSNMEEIVNFALDMYKDEMDRKKIKIEFKVQPDLPQIMIDAEKIKLVVQNLIDNAIKYSLPNGNVLISLVSDGKNVEFKAVDFGVGIPKNQQSKVFAKFYRSEDAEKIDPNGTGLGLFLTNNIVKAHGGKIWFESEEGVGTSFYFSLPIKTIQIN